MKLIELKDKRLAIIGLGYVGLPLAVAFSNKYPVIGFDIDITRVKQLAKGQDRTLEISNEELSKVLITKSEVNQLKTGLYVSSSIADIENANIYIVTVPTPTDRYNRPDLMPMIKASEMIAMVLKKGDIVIYESTVYPGVTEDEMVPLLEKNSKLKFNVDFFCGYSPERINPGDKQHTVTKIIKITSGSTTEIATVIDNLYKSVIEAGTHKAPSIKVAEAAKVIENAQRDINIAFINELSKIFNLIDIDTTDVLEAAATKWNFLKFQPGLVGGHCIGVDPYYLAQKAQELGYHPEIILAGRRLNDSMGKYVATELVKRMIKKDIKIIESKILILGFSFKEDCPDFRNTKVIDIYNELRSYELHIDIFDPWVDNKAVEEEYGINLLFGKEMPNLNDYSAIILAVSHKDFQRLQFEKSDKQVLFDVKGVLDRNLVDIRL